MKNISSTRLLKRGDIIVCFTREWESFTYGKKYEVLMDQIGNVIDVANDKGLRHMPCYERQDVKYFVTLEEWRQMRIDEIIKPVD
jgi:hypothetical protein